MSKRRNATVEETLRWIARGDGQGIGKLYRPFLHVRDVPSQGRSRIVLGIKTGRLHHYLSDIEYSYHMLSEYQINVIDIREQYALLPWKETQDIAQELGIRHPRYPVTQTPIVMTSDIVLTLNVDGITKYGVICVKSSSALDKNEQKTKRVLEKLIIEKTYWQRRDVSWRLSTELELPKNRLANLKFISTAIMAPELNYLDNHLDLFSNIFLREWSTNKPLNMILDDVNLITGIDINTCFSLFSKAVWNRRIPVDLDKDLLSHHYPVYLIK